MPAENAATEGPPLDAERVKQDFPILATEVRGKPLTYLDSAATSQKPSRVLAAVERYYREQNANVHRGVYRLAVEATAAYEEAREKVAALLGAGSQREIVFTRGTTESINLVARSFARPKLAPGASVLITGLEHHSNIVPWQLVCAESGAELSVAPIDERGQVVLSEFERLLERRPVIASFAHVSNALGTVNPVVRMTAMAHERGVPVLVDGAQAVPHGPVDVAALGVDFYAFSGHKAFAPTGIGALWGRGGLLAEMPPYQGGGEMIRSVRFSGTTYAEPPHRFEAGTPNIAGAIGLGAAIDYLAEVGLERIAAHDAALLARATEVVSAIPGVTIIGTAAEKSGALSFIMEGAHPHDVGTILDGEGIAVRAGHHCAQPVMEHFGVPATVRASFALYNTDTDIERLVKGLEKVRELF